MALALTLPLMLLSHLGHPHVEVQGEWDAHIRRGNLPLKVSPAEALRAC